MAGFFVNRRYKCQKNLFDNFKLDHLRLVKSQKHFQKGQKKKEKRGKVHVKKPVLGFVTAIKNIVIRLEFKNLMNVVCFYRDCK